MNWNESMEPYEPDYSKKRVVLIIVSIVAVLVVIFGIFYIIELRNEHRGKNIRAANQYMECDFRAFLLANAYLEGISEWKKEYPASRYKQASHAKLMVFFYPHRPAIESIEYIRVKGPNGYQLDVDISVPYDRTNLNGYNEEGQVLSFHACDVSGFLENGKYLIEVKYKSGKKFSRMKDLRNKYPLLKLFKETPRTFSPVGETTSNELCNNITLKWSTLPNQKLFYCVRLGKYYKEMHFTRMSDLLFFDNIFSGEAGVTGLNKNHADVNLMLDRNVNYTWFVEIVDSNEFHKINLILYQKFQYFKIK